ncbi:TlpA family protein disulfide reductase [Pseudomonas sp. R2.Fl]|nr:TlpA family protein disulfide reductase [Pseudomonas sp. R2.Fl]
MTQKRPFGLPSARLVVIAAVAGIVAGAVAVYVKQAGYGNGVASADAARCGEAVARAEALKPVIRGQVAALVAASEPRRITNLSFKDDSGADTTLDAFAGKALLVNLWATWCVPCREEMPALDNLQKAMGGDRFQVMAINIDTGSEEKPKAFLDEIGVQSLGLYRDSSMGVFNTMKKEGLAFGLPATLLLDEKGCLLGAMNGPAAWDSDDAKALITAAKGA